MSKKQKHVSLEPTEEQRLRLELLQTRCHLNLEAQSRWDAEKRFFECQSQLHQLALYVTEPAKTQAEQELSRLQAEGKQLLQNLVNAGDLVKQENGWPDDTKWNPVTLTFTAPTDSVLVPATEGSKAKITIQ